MSTTVWFDLTSSKGEAPEALTKVRRQRFAEVLERSRREQTLEDFLQECGPTASVLDIAGLSSDGGDSESPLAGLLANMSGSSRSPSFSAASIERLLSNLARPATAAPLDPSRLLGTERPSRAQVLLGIGFLLEGLDPGTSAYFSFFEGAERAGWCFCGASFEPAEPYARVLPASKWVTARPNARLATLIGPAVGAPGELFGRARRAALDARLVDEQGVWREDSFLGPGPWTQPRGGFVGIHSLQQFIVQNASVVEAAPLLS